MGCRFHRDEPWVDSSLDYLGKHIPRAAGCHNRRFATRDRHVFLCRRGGQGEGSSATHLFEGLRKLLRAHEVSREAGHSAGILKVKGSRRCVQVVRLEAEPIPNARKRPELLLIGGLEAGDPGAARVAGLLHDVAGEFYVILAGRQSLSETALAWVKSKR